LVFTTYNPLTFAWWPQFKENYHIDDFTSDAQERLNEVQSCLEAYNVMMQTARKTVQAILQRHIAASIEKEEQRSDYQKWLQGGLGGSYTDEIRWFDFIKLQRAADSPDMPLGKGLSQQWAPKVEWLLVGKADQAAQEIYNTDARQWGAPNGIEFSWFKDIFDVAQADLKSEPVYEQVILAQEELFKRLQDAELMLAEGLRHIRDRYEGGVPLYKNSNRNSRLLTVSRSSSGLSFPQNMWKTPTLGITLILYALPFVNQRSFACIFASGFCIIDPTIILYHSASEIEGVNV
jgi:hypothetical protein